MHRHLIAFIGILCGVVAVMPLGLIWMIVRPKTCWRAVREFWKQAQFNKWG